MPHGSGRAVEVRGLAKSYGGVPAVRGIDVAIERGEIFALLGPNGAGKTTTVEILEGYRSRDAGEVSVLGYDPGHQRSPLKSRIGIVLQSTGVDYMDEAQYLADRVAVIASGRIVAEGPPATLGHRQAARARIRYRLPAGPRPPDGLSGPPGPDGFNEFSPDDVTAALHRLTGWAIEQGVSLDGLEVTRPTLEDVYLQLTGSPAVDRDRPS